MLPVQGRCLTKYLFNKWMNGWMVGWVDGWMDGGGWTDGRMDGICLDFQAGFNSQFHLLPFGFVQVSKPYFSNL